MQHADPDKLVTGIVLTPDEYTAILKELFGDSLSAEFNSDGIWLTYDDSKINDPEAVLYEKLAEYYDVQQIVNVHMDNDEPFRIWVIYKDKH